MTFLTNSIPAATSPSYFIPSKICSLFTVANSGTQTYLFRLWYMLYPNFHSQLIFMTYNLRAKFSVARMPVHVTMILVSNSEELFSLLNSNRLSANWYLVGIKNNRMNWANFFAFKWFYPDRKKRCVLRLAVAKTSFEINETKTKRNNQLCRS